MTAMSESIADAFGPASRPVTGPSAPAAPAAVPRPVRERAAGSGLSGVGAVVGAKARTFAADVAGAWPWRGAPPTLAELVAQRVPDRDRVPGRNLGLWAAWAVWNHVMLPVFAVVYPVLWWAAHPARAVLAAAVAALLFYVWI